MKLLNDIAAAKEAADRAVAAAEKLGQRAADLDRRAEALSEAIARAPVPRVYRVQFRDREIEISEAEALAFMALAFASLDQDAHTMLLVSGETVEMRVGDVDQIVRQIVLLTLMRGGPA